VNTGDLRPTLNRPAAATQPTGRKTCQPVVKSFGHIRAWRLWRDRRRGGFLLSEPELRVPCTENDHASASTTATLAAVVTSARGRPTAASSARASAGFGRLKDDWARAPLRVRGLDRARLHADLTILAEPACALSRTRPVRSRRSRSAEHWPRSRSRMPQGCVASARWRASRRSTALGPELLAAGPASADPTPLKTVTAAGNQTTNTITSVHDRAGGDGRPRECAERGG
jgi:hypothetical protein